MRKPYDSGFSLVETPHVHSKICGPKRKSPSKAWYFSWVEKEIRVQEGWGVVGQNTSEGWAVQRKNFRNMSGGPLETLVYKVALYARVKFHETSQSTNSAKRTTKREL